MKNSSLSHSILLCFSVFLYLWCAGASHAAGIFTGLDSAGFFVGNKYWIAADGSVMRISLRYRGAESEKRSLELGVQRWRDGSGISTDYTVTDKSNAVGEYIYYSLTGLSADGSVIAGYKEFSYLQCAALSWGAHDGVKNIGTLGGDCSRAKLVSGDGRVVVGDSRYKLDSGRIRVFRWTAQEGITDVGTLGGSESYAYLHGISADGSVIVGDARLPNEERRAFRWVRGATDGVIDNPQMTNLGTLGGSFSYATAVSADGAVVVGSSYTKGDNYNHAFIWTKTGGMEDLGSYFGGCYSEALAVSGDGLVVVGTSTPLWSKRKAFRWTRAVGMQTIETWLKKAGVVVPDGWFLSAVTEVNYDGSVLLGEGVNPKGEKEIWYAHVYPDGTK